MTKTLHDQIVSGLDTLVTGMEKGAGGSLSTGLLGLAPCKSVLEKIRIEQSYDPEVMDLLDRIENLEAK